MINTNNILTSGKESANSFKTPEGYFENITARVMSKIPETDNKKVFALKQKRYFARWKWAAAILLIASITYTSALYNSESEKQEDIAIKNIHNEEYDEIMEFADYAMIDKQDLYNFVNEETL